MAQEQQSATESAKPVAWVTGASRGIGWAAAQLLARQGFCVIASARSSDALAALAEKHEAIEPLPFDVGDPLARIEAHSVIVERFGPVDVLVNNAGYGTRSVVEESSAAEMREMFDINLFAPMALAKLVLPSMRQRGQGRIINVSSVVGRVAFPFNGLYSATKHALNGFSDAMRLELAPWGVKVILIEPGPIETNFAKVAKRTAGGRIEDEASPYAPFYRSLFGGAKLPGSNRWPASTVAWSILKAASDPEPRARYQVHGLAWALPILKALLPDRLFDKLLARSFGLDRAEPVR